jgi:hypothetical protein
MISGHLSGRLVTLQLGKSHSVLHTLLVDSSELGLVVEYLLLKGEVGETLLVNQGLVV